jgi:hypothetical protein
MTTKNKNTRSLDSIADDINKLERKSIFEIGDLLLEAKAQCEHGDWLDWLDTEFDWSVDTAARYMKVAELGAKFRSLQNLKLAATTLYALDNQEEDDLPAIIAELEKHATGKKLKPQEAERVILTGIGRHRFGGDYPDATFAVLAELSKEQPWYQQTAAALQEQKPETEDGAYSIVQQIRKQYLETRQAESDAAEQEAEQEAEAILNADPPELPPSIMPPEPQKLGTGTDWAEAEPFANAVRDLLALRTKSLERLVGAVSRGELRVAIDFLMAVDAAEARQEAADAQPA